MRGQHAEQLALPYESLPEAKHLDDQWRSSAEAEQRSRTRFAQAAIHPEEVQQAIDATRLSLGDAADVTPFVRGALTDLGVPVVDTATGAGGGFTADVADAPLGLHDLLGRPSGPLTFAPDYPVPHGTAVLTRTDPAVTAIAQYVLSAALDPALDPSVRPARRAGIIRSRDVQRAALAILVRFRTRLVLPGRTGERVQIAEDARLLAFTGPPSSPTWLAPGEVEALLGARPTGNIAADQARHAVNSTLQALPALRSHLEHLAVAVADELQQSHAAVRRAARGDRVGALGIRGLSVTPLFPADILGVYLYRPDGGTA
jgi:hypothetical protein